MSTHFDKDVASIEESEGHVPSVYDGHVPFSIREILDRYNVTREDRDKILEVLGATDVANRAFEALEEVLDDLPPDTQTEEWCDLTPMEIRVDMQRSMEDPEWRKSTEIPFVFTRIQKLRVAVNAVRWRFGSWRSGL